MVRFSTIVGATVLLVAGEASARAPAYGEGTSLYDAVAHDKGTHYTKKRG